MIIDFHTHTFPAKIAARALDKMSRDSRVITHSDGTAEGLSLTMERSGVDLSVNLPVMTSTSQVEKINDGMIASQEYYRNLGIVPFGGIHPDYELYAKELHRLKENGIKGIKIHPAYQNADLDDIRFLRILDAASAEDLIVVTHAGLDIGIPHHNFASIDMITRVIDQVAPTKFVLAHMGGWDGWDDVEKYLAGAPVWLDTAFSLGGLDFRPDVPEPLPDIHNMTIEDFVRLSRKHGTDRVLFATDNPWASASSYIDLLEHSSLSAGEKEQIYHHNAEELLSLT